MRYVGHYTNQYSNTFLLPVLQILNLNRSDLQLQLHYGLKLFFRPLIAPYDFSVRHILVPSVWHAVDSFSVVFLCFKLISYCLEDFSFFFFFENNEGNNLIFKKMPVYMQTRLLLLSISHSALWVTCQLSVKKSPLCWVHKCKGSLLVIVQRAVKLHLCI